MLSNKISDYFAKNKEQFEKLTKNNNDFNTKIYRDNESNNVIDILHNDELLIRAKYEVVGYYNVVSSTWTWAWANPFIEKDLVTASQKLQKIRETIITTDKLPADDRELYLYFISNPVFYISADNITMLMQMILYFTDGTWIVPRKNNNNIPTQLEFILIKNILQIK